MRLCCVQFQNKKKQMSSSSSDKDATALSPFNMLSACFTDYSSAVAKLEALILIKMLCKILRVPTFMPGVLGETCMQTPNWALLDADSRAPATLLLHERALQQNTYANEGPCILRGSHVLF
jgi:hypothetical protein